MNCKCSIAKCLVGDGCSECNPDMARDIQIDNAFDAWFDKQGYAEQHRDVFEGVWKAAVTWCETA